MGCDYYIEKVLQIYYNENEYLEFFVERERANYYYYLYDEDDENYDALIDEYKKDVLKPKMKPIIIYNNDNFNKPSSEVKYKNIVEYEVKNSINKEWSDIIKIIKVEKRYERL